MTIVRVADITGLFKGVSVNLMPSHDVYFVTLAAIAVQPCVMLANIAGVTLQTGAGVVQFITNSPRQN
jgi:hypothetical protein